jgi:two-component system, chemotaxis family, sensor histidine kinase and response regulator PixL
MLDSSIQEQGYSYFLTEAQDLLQAIEQDLLGLKEDRSPAHVHNLMRSAHTLKGAAASVGANSIKSMAHSIEDVFKSLYNPDVVVDTELEGLLLEAYQCLRMPISAAVAGTPSNDADVLQRSDLVFKKLKTKLGKYFDPGAAIPSSAELGFDITLSIFESGVNSRLDELEQVLGSSNQAAITEMLQAHADIFSGLAESLSLTGFGAIAKTTLKAMQTQPEQILIIAQTALADFRQGQAAVFGGDRTRGGEPSEVLKALAKKKSSAPQKSSVPQKVSTHQRSVTQATRPVRSQSSFIRQFPRAQKLLRVWQRLVQLFNAPFPVKEPAALPPAPVSQPMPTPPVVEEPVFLDFNDSQPTDFNSLTPEPDGFVDFNSLENASLPDLSALPPLPDLNLDAGLLDLGNWGELEGLAIEIEPFNPEPFSIEPPQVEHTEPFNPELFSIEPPQVKSPEPVISAVQETRSQPLPASPSPKIVPQVPPKKTAAPALAIRVNLEHLESLSHSVGELLINQNRQALQDERLQRQIQELLEGLNQHKQTLTRLRDWSDHMLIMSDGKYGSAKRWGIQTTAETEGFDPLELDRHSELHVFLYAALEELVQLSATTEAIDLATRQSSQSLGKQGRLLNHVRDDLMEARMIPIGSVLSRLPRVLQQLMEAHDKQVELLIQGAQVLVDKAIAEKLYDPLLHLVRNAFDHGVENSQARRQQGKSEMGQIKIKAYQQGNRTLIEVSDDGQGLNLQKICRRGFEMKLLPSTRPEDFTEDELLELLFQSGFSTADEITDLSGRGVGLDVVRNQLRSLEGNVTVESVPYRGTTFSMQLPLTLMTARLLVCQMGHAVYGFLSDEIEKILIPQANQIETMGGQSVFHWRRGQEEHPVPIYQLSDLVNYNTSLPEQIKHEISLKTIHNLLPVAADPSLLLMRWKDGFLGISVEQILGEQELVIRPVSRAIAVPNYIYGCSILADGQLTLVIDGKTLVNHGSRNVMAPLHQMPKPLELSQPEMVLTEPIVLPTFVEPPAPVAKPAVAAKQVLVIDDSVTVRQTLSLTLKKAGYKVLQAQDGLDAIAQLQQHSNIQLITCDLEMPRLNGFEFLMRYKKEFSTTAPVTMLTSRSSEKHRQLALQLGASAYLTKPYTEHELLSTLSNLNSRT